MSEEELRTNESDVKRQEEDTYARVEATHIPVPLPGHYGHKYQRNSILTVHYLKKGR